MCGTGTPEGVSERSLCPGSLCLTRLTYLVSESSLQIIHDHPINPRHLHDLNSNDIQLELVVPNVSSLSSREGPVDTTGVTQLKLWTCSTY